MTQFLPANLLALFAPRDPIPYLPPEDQLPYEKQTAGYTGLAAFVKHFEDPSQTPAPVKIETREERHERKRKMKAEQVAYKLEQDIALWQPNVNPAATLDPYKTLFVARINYDTSETKISREFQVYGPIRKVVKVNNKFTNKPRGYAFIEYEHERDMHSAYKHADGKKLSNRRVLVDVERGRIVKGWLPRRLGGGLGGTRKGGPDVNIKHSGREEAAPDNRYIGGGGGMKERTIDRDRERPERPERRRSRSRERRRRSRSRSRDRHRGERRKRERSRDRSDRGRDHDTGSTVEKVEGAADGIGEGAPEAEPPRKERRRSRSRDRERKHRRSRSRDRKRRDHDRERDRDRESRRERGGAEREERNERPEEEVSQPPEPNPESFNSSGYEGEYNNFNNNGETNTYDGY